MQILEILTNMLKQGRFTGMSAKIVKKMITNYSSALANTAVDKLRVSMESITRLAALKIVHSIRVKVSVALTIPIAIIALIAMAITAAAGGNILIPLGISIVLILLLWLVIKAKLNSTARRAAMHITNVVCQTVEQALSSLQSNVESFLE